MRPVLFHIGDFAVSSFWTMAFLGFFAAFLVFRSEIRRRRFEERFAYDVTLWAYVGGWVGARLFVIPAGWKYFVEDPIAFLLSGSGWVWYGGLIGGTVACLLWARRESFPMLTLADMVAPAIAIGLGIGRIGCQLSGDGDYGVPSDLPWAMAYPHGTVPTTDRVHPAPVYEMLGCFAIFAHLWRQRLSEPAPGTIFARYLVLSGILRFFIEFVRRNPNWILGLTTAQWFSIASVGIGIALARRAGNIPSSQRPTPVEPDRRKPETRTENDRK